MIKYIKEIFCFPLLLVKHRELLWSFIRRELKARLEGSILGRMWPVLQPLALFAIYYCVFAKLLKIPVNIDLLPWENPHPEVGSQITNEVLNSSNSGWRATFFLVSGILPWIAVSESLIRSSGIVLENANLIKKIAFPSEFLPTYIVLLNAFYFLIGFVILLIMEVCVNGYLPANLIWFPLLLILQIFFVLGLGMLVGALNIFIRDVAQVIPLFTMFWMFSSPIFYEPRVLAMLGSQKQRGFIEMISPYMWINPIYNLLTIYRDIFKGGKSTEIVAKVIINPVTEKSETIHIVQNVVENSSISYDCLLIFAAQALITFVVGYGFFLRSKGRFADEV